MFQGLNFPPLDLPPECTEIRAEIRAFLAEERKLGNAKNIEAMSRYTPEYSERLGKAGFIGLTWPKKYGGHERSALERYVVTEEMLSAGAPTGCHWIADRQSGPLILKFGTEEQRETILPKIAAGEAYFCIGMSEPNSGSDLASVQTKATKTDGGWLLNGTKLWTSGAHISHYMIALVRTSPLDEKDRHAGFSQMIIDMKSPGLEISPVINLSGDHHFNEEVFTDCFVPDEMVVGEVGNGWNQVMSELGYERSGPERFLSTFQLFAELVDAVGDDPSDHEAQVIGRLAAQLIVLRQMSLSVAGMLGQGLVPANEASIVKDLGTNYCKLVPDLSRSIMAAMPSQRSSISYEATLASAILTVPSLTIQGGSREILRGVIARGLGMR
ncbi:MAG: acyl-CoA dehydrogenase [Alphaproteobacteria bacterium]|nr:MAG: acyl-CoA dehydrogenase [Alphaproteobacteria bacterium]